MSDLTRREFLSKTFLSATTLMAISPAVFAINKMNAHDKRYLQALSECAIVYAEWNKTEDLMPAHYFVSAMKGYGLEPWKISEASKLDFQYNNFFVVDGLQLSKTEAAFLALLGEKS